jgi:hypothetical protein
MAGLLDWISQQNVVGAGKNALTGLLQPTNSIFDALVAERNPQKAKDIFNKKALQFYQQAQTPEGALDVALNFAPLGVTKIVSPTQASKLSSLEQEIFDKGGDYALQRFQKAKSLAPDIEKQYTKDALSRLFTEREMYGLTVMKPSEFEKFAAPLAEGVESSKKYSKRSIEDTDYLSYPDYIDYLKQVRNETGFREVPYLHLNKTETGLPLNPFISGHEGRHRSRALSQMGDNPTLVQLKPRGDLYKSLPTNISDYGLPINTQKEFVNALNKEMSLNANVRPQMYLESQPNSLFEKEVRRDAIPFPNEIFGAGLLSVPLMQPEDKKKKRKAK